MYESHMEPQEFIVWGMEDIEAGIVENPVILPLKVVDFMLPDITRGV